VFNPLEIPLLNTVILVSSGATVTWAHHALICGDRKSTILGLVLTVSLGIIFTALQGYEYIMAPFTITDSVYGSTFFCLTGLHGFHVIVGTGFLFFSLLRVIKHHFTKEHHLGLESAILYWHLVDVVWLFLFVWLFVVCVLFYGFCWLYVCVDPCLGYLLVAVRSVFVGFVDGLLGFGVCVLWCF